MRKTFSRRLRDVSKTCLQDVLKTCIQDILTSSGRLPDVLETKKMFTGKESISVSNKCKYASDKSLSNKLISDKSKANSREI